MSEREITMVESFSMESGLQSRPPSYKLNTTIDMDAIEAQCRSDILSLNKLPTWYKHFNGAPLVFWLLFFVMLGTVSIFIPSLPNAAFLLWLPLLLYFFGLLVIQYKYRQRLQKINQIKLKLADIRYYRQQVANQSIDLPDHLFFLHYQPNPFSNPYTTLLPPPPSYQSK
ncbi:unnamed protein product [Cunninghamella echinulata]